MNMAKAEGDSEAYVDEGKAVAEVLDNKPYWITEAMPVFLPNGTKLYVTPPTVDAAVEAFRLKAIVELDPLQVVTSEIDGKLLIGIDDAINAIRALPGGTSALEEKCMEVAEEVRKADGLLVVFDGGDLRAIVRKVLLKR